MEKSVELEALCYRFYEARATGNAKATASFFSRQVGVLAIGTDPAEWWEGRDAVHHAVKMQSRQIGKIRIRVDQLRAFAEGTAGWCAGQLTMQIENGRAVLIRSTMVFHKERGAWKIVQYHASLASPNADAIGKQ